eukprot:PhM_4_TR14119/c0_g1_i1/m.43073
MLSWEITSTSVAMPTERVSNTVRGSKLRTSDTPAHCALTICTVSSTFANARDICTYRRSCVSVMKSPGSAGTMCSAARTSPTPSPPPSDGGNAMALITSSWICLHRISTVVSSVSEDTNVMHMARPAGCPDSIPPEVSLRTVLCDMYPKSHVFIVSSNCPGAIGVATTSTLVCGLNASAVRRRTSNVDLLLLLLVACDGSTMPCFPGAFSNVLLIFSNAAFICSRAFMSASMTPRLPPRSLLPDHHSVNCSNDIFLSSSASPSATSKVMSSNSQPRDHTSARSLLTSIKPLPVGSNLSNAARIVRSSFAPIFRRSASCHSCAMAFSCLCFTASWICFCRSINSSNVCFSARASTPIFSFATFIMRLRLPQLLLMSFWIACRSRKCFPRRDALSVSAFKALIIWITLFVWLRTVSSALSHTSAQPRHGSSVAVDSVIACPVVFGRDMALLLPPVPPTLPLFEVRCSAVPWSSISSTLRTSLCMPDAADDMFDMTLTTPPGWLSMVSATVSAEYKERVITLKSRQRTLDCKALNMMSW